MLSAFIKLKPALCSAVLPLFFLHSSTPKSGNNSFPQVAYFFMVMYSCHREDMFARGCVVYGLPSN